MTAYGPSPGAWMTVTVKQRDTALRRIADWQAVAESRRAENQRLREALERIREEQPQVLAKLEHNGIVFDSIGADPKNWQHVAFTIYNHLCVVDLEAREALAGDAE